uniref:Uncharacterized protein orf37 n=1 Tax=Dictyota dichotoma TaxID=2876 RepID=Q2TUC7_DICDH|nr:hypothetical protein DidiocMp08 [Dictyota dichotoma]AAV53393.1 hypothetical protein [Dictyota dichotoma]
MFIINVVNREKSVNNINNKIIKKSIFVRFNLIFRFVV